MISQALFTSLNEHYCSPPEIVVPMHRVLRPDRIYRADGSTIAIEPESHSRLLDPATNTAAITRPDVFANGIDVDGRKLPWDCADAWYNNPPYGRKIVDWVKLQHFWGRTRLVPGISLLPSRTDTGWMQQFVFASADAWIFVTGRLTFWVPIPVELANAAPSKKRKDSNGKLVDVGPYYLKRWHPGATDELLPKPFRLLEPGFAVGPELGANGRPQPAPFPSLVAYWGPDVREFARHFLPLGHLIIARGPYAGSYPQQLPRARQAVAEVCSEQTS